MLGTWKMVFDSNNPDHDVIWIFSLARYNMQIWVRSRLLLASQQCDWALRYGNGIWDFQMCIEKATSTTSVPGVFMHVQPSRRPIMATQYHNTGIDLCSALARGNPIVIYRLQAKCGRFIVLRPRLRSRFSASHPQVHYDKYWQMIPLYHGKIQAGKVSQRK